MQGNLARRASARLDSTDLLHDAGSQFRAEFDAEHGLLRLAGACRTSDLELFDQAVTAWHAAGPRTLDLERMTAFDIGPAWLLKRALDFTDGVEIRGAVPRHFAYLNELE